MRFYITQHDKGDVPSTCTINMDGTHTAPPVNLGAWPTTSRYIQPLVYRCLYESTLTFYIIRTAVVFRLTFLFQWSSTFFGLPPTFNLVGSPPPTSVCKSFLTRRFGLICMPHVIRLDAKRSAKGCATCTWLEGATTCGVIQCYPMASGVESQGGPRGSTTHFPSNVSVQYQKHCKPH